MSSPAFVTQASFHPLFEAIEDNPKTHPADLARSLDLQPIVIIAMNTARKQQRLRPIPKLGFRHFIEGRAYNNFATSGPLGLLDAEFEAASCFFTSHLEKMLEDFLAKHKTGRSGIDKDWVSQNIHHISDAMNAFLEAPKLYTRKKDMPRSTGFLDRHLLEEKGVRREYLVRFNDWSPSLFQRTGTGKWEEVPA